MQRIEINKEERLVTAIVAQARLMLKEPESLKLLQLKYEDALILHWCLLLAHLSRSARRYNT